MTEGGIGSKEVWRADLPAIAAKVNHLIKLVAGEVHIHRSRDCRSASRRTAGPRTAHPAGLDDAWEAEQLAVFTQGGRRCAWLITTRLPSFLPSRSIGMRVDQTSRQQDGGG